MLSDKQVEAVRLIADGTFYREVLAEQDRTAIAIMLREFDDALTIIDILLEASRSNEGENPQMTRALKEAQDFLRRHPAIQCSDADPEACAECDPSFACFGDTTEPCRKPHGVDILSGIKGEG